MGEYHSGAHQVDVTVGGVTKTITVRYDAEFSEGADRRITGQYFEATPCDIFGTPFEAALRVEITPWLKQEVLNAFFAADLDIPLDIQGAVAALDAEKLFGQASSACGASLNPLDANSIITASIDENGQGLAVVENGDGSSITKEFDHQDSETWSERTTIADAEDRVFRRRARACRDAAQPQRLPAAGGDSGLVLTA